MKRKCWWSSFDLRSLVTGCSLVGIYLPYLWWLCDKELLIVLSSTIQVSLCDRRISSSSSVVTPSGMIVESSLMKTLIQSLHLPNLWPETFINGYRVKDNNSRYVKLRCINGKIKPPKGDKKKKYTEWELSNILAMAWVLNYVDADSVKDYRLHTVKATGHTSWALLK